MLRVLLAIEDYNELVFLQTLLKKLGIDVDGAQTERQFGDLLLTLNPEVVVATARGKKINGIEMAEGLRKNARGQPHVVLLVPESMQEKFRDIQINNVDRVLVSPVNPRQLLVALAQMSGVSEQTLLDKFAKLKATLSSEKAEDRQILSRDQDSGAEVIKGAGPKESSTAVTTRSRMALQECTISSEDRKRRYDKVLGSNPPPVGPKVFDKQKVMDYNKRIRAEEAAIDTKPLEEERQQFVKALFKQAK